MGSLYGYQIASDLPLRRLQDAAGTRGSIRIERTTEQLLDVHGELTAWHEWPALDGEGFALARTADGVAAWCSVTGSFLIDPVVGTIRSQPLGRDENWEHRIGTTVVPLMLAERGDLIVHASAVVTDGRAVLFCGPSERGKSTLALALGTLGYPVLSEDGGVVEAEGTGHVVWPGLRGVRVSGDAARAAGDVEAGPDAGRGLRCLPPESQATGPAPLGAVVMLEERGKELTIERLKPADALIALVPSLLHSGGTDAIRPAFSRAADLAAQVPIFRASIPDDLSEIGPAASELIGAVSGAVASPSVRA
jgi:hypothetical protein